MSRIISQSNMNFGPFEEDCLYEIENSSLVRKLELKIVEFIVYFKQSLIILEAKQSSPSPIFNIETTTKKFDDFIDEIASKFINSVNLFFSVQLQRYADTMGNKLKEMELAKVNIRLVFVIKNHKNEWLPPVSDALKIKLSDLAKSCRINPCNIMIVNEEIALEKKLIRV